MPVDDYLQGTIYSIYIDSQNIAIISASDTGVVALQQVAQLGNEIAAINKKFADMGASQSVAEITASSAIIDNLTVSKALTLTNSVVLPTGSTCTNPTAANQVANKSYVDAEIDAKIKEYHRTFHIFGVDNPNPNNLVEGAIYYKYK